MGDKFSICASTLNIHLSSSKSLLKSPTEMQKQGNICMFAGNQGGCHPHGKDFQESLKWCCKMNQRLANWNHVSLCGRGSICVLCQQKIFKSNNTFTFTGHFHSSLQRKHQVENQCCSRPSNVAKQSHEPKAPSHNPFTTGRWAESKR